VRSRAKAALPWLAAPYRVLRALSVPLCLVLPLARDLFHRRRRTACVRCWTDGWLARRSGEPQELAGESFQRYREELGIAEDHFSGRNVVDSPCGPRNSLAGSQASIPPWPRLRRGFARSQTSTLPNTA